MADGDSDNDDAPSGAGGRATGGENAVWIPVGDVATVTKRKKTVVVTEDGTSILVVAYDGSFHAMDNICIHRDRELAKGVVLNGRLICPGHQWAFDLTCGWEAVKQQCQPTYHVRVVDGVVEVDSASRTVLTEAPE